MQDQVVNALASRLEQFMMGYGYEKIETPIIQPAELFLTKAGDQIIHRLFTFERLGKQLALRPEFTALAAHLYNTRYPAGDQPVMRWQFGGAIFEDAAGDTQRFSIGAELIGMSGAAAEAEIIALAANGAGLENWTLVIGHAQMMRVLLERFKLDSRTQRFLLHHLPALKANLPQTGKAFVLDELDKLLLGKGAQEEAGAETLSELGTQQMLDVLLDATQRGTTMGGRTRHDIVRRLLQKRQRATERGQVVAALDFLEAWSAISAPPSEAFAAIERMIGAEDAEAQQVLNQWRAEITLLEAYGVPASRISIQPALARNWDYYTGIVFELWSGTHHVGGGGRYDELTRLIGGERDVPAVGFAYYIEPLLAALPEPAPTVQTAITITASAETMPAAIRWAQKLRALGQNVILSEGTGGGGAFTAQSDGTLKRADQAYPTLEAVIDAMEAIP